MSAGSAFNAAAQSQTPQPEDVKNFMNAAFDGDRAGIEAFLDKFGNHSIEVTKGEPIGWTALLWAAQAGNAESIGLLLERGADIERRDSNNATPLLVAAHLGRTAAVLCLLEKGANAEAVNGEGKSAADFARDKPDIAGAIGAAVAARQKIRAEAAAAEAEIARAAREAAERTVQAFQDGMRGTARAGRFRLRKAAP